VTYLQQKFISADDSPSIDAFSRWRTSEPYTIFDSKQLHDAAPLFFDDQETSGSGTSSSHSVNRASSTLGVTAATAGTRVRQTFERFNYQPGKSQLAFVTFADLESGTGVTKRAGLFDGENGVFVECDEGTCGVGIRSYATGSAVDNTIVQSSWNLDTLDGNGPSGITLDFSKVQIFVVDFEWLGVGRVRTGFCVDGLIYYCHEFLHANNITSVYMSTPNLPIRYEIIADGTNGIDTFECICSSVISEGGRQDSGISRYVSTGATHVDANTVGTVYFLCGIRLKTTHLDATVSVQRVETISEINDDYEWLLYLNPTFSTAPTFADLANSVVQTATGATANTITAGTVLDGGHAKASSSMALPVSAVRKLGASIAGTPDVIALAARPLSVNADIQGGMTWIEVG
jgi:hypothetical protein